MTAAAEQGGTARARPLVVRRAPSATCPWHRCKTKANYRHGLFQRGPKRSFRATTSSIRSASTFFKRLFSSASTLSFWASDDALPWYFDFQRWKVCSLIPCRWHTSAVGLPASCSRSTLRICASSNLLFFTRPPSWLTDPPVNSRGEEEGRSCLIAGSESAPSTIDRANQLS